MADRKSSKKSGAKAPKKSNRKSVARAPKKKSKRTAKAKTAAVATVLMLRTCGPQGEAHNGFRWPLKVGAVVEAPDWEPTRSCGRGLHGLLFGEGDPTSAWHWEEGAKWLVVEVPADSIVDLGAKYKFPRCTIVHVGDQKSATEFVAADPRAAGKAILGGTATAGYRGTATAGDRGTATAGYGGTATAGDGGTATAGDRGTATAGYGGTATAGDRGTATAGDGGTATAGDRGTATAGYGGTATAGDGGTATAGVGGTATAGVGGTISIRWYDGARDKYRLAIGEVGENGIEPNVAYVVVDGKLAKKAVSP